MTEPTIQIDADLLLAIHGLLSRLFAHEITEELTRVTRSVSDLIGRCERRKEIDDD